MANVKDFEEYEMTDEDIDKVVRYLKTIDPDNATPENAIAFIEHFRIKLHMIMHELTDKQMLELYEEFAKENNTKKD